MVIYRCDFNKCMVDNIKNREDYHFPTLEYTYTTIR